MFVPTSHHGDYPAGRLAAAKRGRVVSVCIPARNEEATVGAIVRTIRDELVERTRLVDEVLVVDDSSSDGTAGVARRAGARVIDAADVLTDYYAGAGKGAAMWKGAAAAVGDVVVFCDADVTNFGPRFVTGLLGPLLVTDEPAMVKAFYERPLDGRPGEGGRVTELVARPLISLLFPHLSGVIQPLSGECAMPREVLEAVPFATGYGVELGLLVEVAVRFGSRALFQVDLGERVHRNRPLDELGPQAMAILQTAFDRAGVGWRPEWSTTLVRPGRTSVEVDEAFLPPLLEVPAYRRRSA